MGTARDRPYGLLLYLRPSHASGAIASDRLARISDLSLANTRSLLGEGETPAPMESRYSRRTSTSAEGHARPLPLRAESSSVAESAAWATNRLWRLSTLLRDDRPGRGSFLGLKAPRRRPSTASAHESSDHGDRWCSSFSKRPRTCRRLDRRKQRARITEFLLDVAADTLQSVN
jgi:hypothetical protein